MDRALLVCVLKLLLIGVISAAKVQRTSFRWSELPSLRNRNSRVIPSRNTYFNRHEKRPFDEIGSGLIGKRPFDEIGSGLIGKRPFDEIGSGLIGKRPFDEIGDGLIGKRPFDEIGSGLIGKRPFDEIGSGLIGKRTFDEIGSGLIGKRSIHKNENKVNVQQVPHSTAPEHNK